MPTTSFAGLPEQTWDDLAGGYFYSTAAWQRYCTEETQTDGEAVVTRVDGELAWAAPVRELAGLADWSSYRWNDHLVRAGLPALDTGGLLVGPSEGFQTHLLAGPAGQVATLPGFIDALRRRGDSSSGRSTVAMFVSTETARQLVAAGTRHTPVLIETDAWLEVPSGGWEEYLARFPKKRRRNIRVERERFAAAGLTVSHVQLEECWWKLGLPAASLLQKYGHTTTPETELVSLRRAADVLGPLARVALCHPHDAPDDPIGFCIYYDWFDVVYIRWAGFDTARLRNVEEYYNTLFYSQIERAGDANAQWIHAGATTASAKALRGCELRPLWLVDLTADSPLKHAGQAISKHNAEWRGKLSGDARTAGALTACTDWTAFDGF